jgi:hypothetical protein
MIGSLDDILHALTHPPVHAPFTADDEALVMLTAGAPAEYVWLLREHWRMAAEIRALREAA